MQNAREERLWRTIFNAARRRGSATGARGRIDLLIEAFNLTNHVNIIPTSVNRNINSAAFLDRRTSRDARQIQWGVRRPGDGRSCR